MKECISEIDDDSFVLFFSCSHLFVFISFRLDTLRKDKKYWVSCNVTKFQSIYAFLLFFRFMNWHSILSEMHLKCNFKRKRVVICRNARSICDILRFV